MKHQAKRVCIIRHGYYPKDSRVYKEARALAEAGYLVDIICLKTPGSPWHEQIDGVEVYRIPQTHRRGSKTSYIIEYLCSCIKIGTLISALYLRRRYACIQVNTLPDILVFTTLLPRLFGARILLDLHEPTPELLLTIYGEKVSLCMLRTQILFERMAICYAHRSITVNNTIRQRFIDRSANPDRIDIVRNVPPDDFGLPDAPESQHAGFILITHGTLQPRYGQDVLLRALPLIRDRIGGLQLIIVGSGETKENLEQLTKELGCEDLVTFTGHVSRNRVAELIKQADVGVIPLLPTPFSDLCQPNKLFEYIELQVPVVSSRLSAIIESFDESCIRYFHPGSHEHLAEVIADLAEDAQQRHLLSENAFSHYRTMRWQEAKKDYVRIVDKLTEPDSTHTHLNEASCHGT